MKITLNWLRQYVEFDWTPEELTERLTMLGLEVEGVHKSAGTYEGVVVAQILASEKHPNADKLSVCRVADGQSERQIVCGAKNYAVGDKVPLILPEHTLPARPGEAAITIRAGKIRGVESQGMLCSPKELGLAEESDGLLILPKDAVVGQPFAQHLGRPIGDVVYDLEVTPNRPDLNSVIGIAREVSALTGKPLRKPEIRAASPHLKTDAASVNDLVDVRIEDAQACVRYVARLVRGVKIGPSPDWLKCALEKVGVRSINNVVDVTNYVMLEIGQPLHAFDYHRLRAAPGKKTPVIVVRSAAEKEAFTALDGQGRTLSNGMLLIADETQPIALAGIMGGQNTEILPSTVDVLLESACFNPRVIRATSKKLELRSESSYRFERGADPAITDWASQRAADLIIETAGGELAQGVIDNFPTPPGLVAITLRHAKVRELLGIEIAVASQIEWLRRLELSLVGSEHGAFNSFRVPSFRVDLKQEIDLIEEIARLHGVDRIPATPPRGAIGSHPFDTVYDSLGEVRRLLISMGLMEAQSQTLVSESSAGLVELQPGHSLVRLANPLSSDMNVLRPGLLLGLLDALRHNLHHKTNDVCLFEIGKVFTQKAGAIFEQRRLSIAITGQRQPPFWAGEDRNAKVDGYDLKGLLQEFFDQFGLRGVLYTRADASTRLFLESAKVLLGRQTLGELGQLLPGLARRYDLRDAVLLAEFDLDLLLARRNPAKNFRPLPSFPFSQRDVAMVLPEETTHDAVLNAVKQAKPPHLEAVELFDVYRGQNVPAGQKSVAYSFTYRGAERTLTDAEVNSAHEKVLQQLKQSLRATIRE